MKVFIDTNVLLDVLAERKGFYAAAMRVWTLAKEPNPPRGHCALTQSSTNFLARDERGFAGIQFSKAFFKIG